MHNSTIIILNVIRPLFGALLIVYPCLNKEIILNDSQCIFFLFTEVDKAVAALNGRYFAGRIVRASRYDQDMFDANDLSG